MLYLIGGTSRSGKSIAARRILQKATIAYLPLDAVVMAFTRGLPEFGVHDKLFPDDIARRLTPFVNALCESVLYAGVDVSENFEAALQSAVDKLLVAA